MGGSRMTYGVLLALAGLLFVVVAMSFVEAETADSFLANKRSRESNIAVESSTDRPGSDYRSFKMPTADLRDRPDLACRSSCKKDARCKAWTYVNPGVQGPIAVCYLKNAVPAARPNKCCTSGTM
jgi:PAN domain